MTQLRTAFDDLIATHPSRGAEAVLTAARADAGGPEGRGHRRLLVAAVVILVAALAALTIGRNDDHQRITTTPPMPDPTVAASTSTSTRGSSGSVLPAEGVVLADGDGVRIEFDTGPIPVAHRAAAIAFATRTTDETGRSRWAVAYQDRDPAIDDVARPTGPVRDRPAWESPTLAARLLPDGAVAALQPDGVERLVVRWEPGHGPPVWTVRVGTDRAESFAADSEFTGQVLAIGRTGDGTPTFERRSIDLRSGATHDLPTIAPKIDEASPREGLSCTDLLADGDVLCASPADGVVVVGDDGVARSVRGSAPGQIATLIR